MPDHVKEQVADALQTVLAAVAGVRVVERRDLLDHEARRTPEITWLLGDEVRDGNREDHVGLPLRCELTVRITYAAPRGDTDRARQTGNEWSRKIQAAVEADRTLGGLVTGIDYQAESFAFESEAKRRAANFITYFIRYRRRHGAPDTAY